jgi:hypothetical protein
VYVNGPFTYTGTGAPGKTKSLQGDIMESILSDAVLVIHFGWILFIILGFPIALAFGMRRLRIFHSVAMVVTVVMQVTGTICPLTDLEEYLRRTVTPGFSYGGSFIVSWLRHLIYIEDIGVSLTIIYVLTGIYLLFVILSYFIWPIRKSGSTGPKKV